MHCLACNYPKMSIEYKGETFCRRCLKRHVKNEQGEWELKEKEKNEDKENLPKKM